MKCQSLFSGKSKKNVPKCRLLNFLLTCTIRTKSRRGADIQRQADSTRDKNPGKLDSR